MSAPMDQCVACGAEAHVPGFSGVCLGEAELAANRGLLVRLGCERLVESQRSVSASARPNITE
eukprot:6191030-Pleurochrysis_carterae.AAC.3